MSGSVLSKPADSIFKQMAILLLLCFLLHGCKLPLNSPDNKQATNPAASGNADEVPVKLQEAKEQLVKDSSIFIGHCGFRKVVTLRPQISGCISKILRHSGESVSKNEIIMQINPAKQVNAVQGTQFAVSSTEAEKDGAKNTLQALLASKEQKLINLEFDQEQYKRYHDLFQQGVASQEDEQKYATQLKASQSEINRIDNEIKAQQAAIERLERTIEQAKLSVVSQEIELGYYTIRSPLSGTLGDLPVKIGDFVTTDSALATISSHTPIEISISVPAAQAKKISLGLEQQLLDNDEKTIGKAKVFFISPKVTDDTQSVQVKALFDNSHQVLRSGQTLKVKMEWDKRMGMTVPTAAVTRIAEQDFVYVAEVKNKQLVAKLKPLKLGAQHEGFYEVLSGLSPGERVVVVGNENLSDGLPIRPQT